MTNSLIGYASDFDSATLSAISDPASTPKENAANWNLFDHWQPAASTGNWLEFDFGAAVSVSYIGLYSSDLYTFAGAELNLFSGASPAPTTSRVQENITTEGPKLFNFSPVSARYWRVRFDTTASQAPKIQIVRFGAVLELERGLRPGFRPPALGSDQKPLNSISESAIFLGRSNRREPIDFTLSTDTLTAAWVRANWPALRSHVEQYPFFLLPEPDAYPDEAVLAWSKTQELQPAYSHSTHFRLSLNLQAFK